MALKTLFRPNLTTAAVLSQFHNIIEQLGQVRDAHIQIADDKEDAASVLLTEANDARREASRAGEALGRIEGIFGTS